MKVLMGPLSAVTLFCFSSVVLEAQSFSINSESGFGTTMGNLQLRDSPPEGMFYSKGNLVGIVPKDLPVIVEERKDVQTLFGSQEWLHVKPAGPTAETGNFSGWIFNGQIEQSDGSFKPYIELVPGLPPSKFSGVAQ